MFKFLLKKKFWTWWFIISITGAFIGIYVIERQKTQLNNSVKCITKSINSSNSIIIIEYNQYIDKYQEYISENHEFLNFNFKRLNEGDTVYILDTIKQNGLLNILYKKNKYIKTGIISPIFIGNCFNSDSN